MSSTVSRTAPSPPKVEGNPDGAVNLGRIYEKGIGVNQDLNQAAFWYGIAAKAGNQEAKARRNKKKHERSQ
jgi:TPR repeat protein